MARGRPKKIPTSTSELIAKHNQRVPLTLAETAQVMAACTYVVKDKRTGEVRRLEPKKLSLMGIDKIEKRALSKLRIALAQYGIKDLSDVFEPDFNMPAKPYTASSDD